MLHKYIKNINILKANRIYSIQVKANFDPFHERGLGNIP